MLLVALLTVLAASYSAYLAGVAVGCGRGVSIGYRAARAELTMTEGEAKSFVEKLLKGGDSE